MYCRWIFLFRTKDGNETMRFSKLLIRLTGRNFGWKYLGFCHSNICLALKDVSLKCKEHLLFKNHPTEANLYLELQLQWVSWVLHTLYPTYILNKCFYLYWFPVNKLRFFIPPNHDLFIHTWLPIHIYVALYQLDEF